MEGILKTKIQSPLVFLRGINRKRLIDRMNGGIESRVVLLIAPGGYGKSYLLNQWAVDFQNDIAWYLIDEFDNEPKRFLTYLIHALREISPDIGENILEVLRTPCVWQEGGITNEGLLTRLITELGELAMDIFLVFDDYHYIDNTDIHKMMFFFISNLPPNVHLIITSRTDPDLPLARMRANGELLDIRMDQLKFSYDEIDTYLSRIIGLDISQKDTLRIWQITEGWPTGVQMIGLSLQRDSNKPDILGRFSASNRLILDYFSEQVLINLPEQISDFLEMSSILTRLNPHLCNYVMEIENSKEIISYLETNNLFLIPLDTDRQWFRYHNLFRDLLEKRVKNNTERQIHQIYFRASQWFEKIGNIDEAVNYSMAAGDFYRAADLLENHVLNWVGQGDLYLFSHWLKSIPGELFESAPWLVIAQGWVLLQTAKWKEADKLIEGLEISFIDAENEINYRRILGHVLLLRSYISLLHEQDHEARSLAEKAINNLSDSDLSEKAFATTLIAISELRFGDLDKVKDLFQQALSYSIQGENRSISTRVLCEISNIEYIQGNLKKHQEVCQQAINMSCGIGPNGDMVELPFAGYAYSLMSSVYLEWNELDQAFFFARRGLDISKQWGLVEAINIGLLDLAKVYAAAGYTDKAMETIMEVERLSRSMPEQYRERVQAWIALIHVECGKYQNALGWCEASKLSHQDKEFVPIWKYILFSEILINQGQFDEALRLLSKLLASEKINQGKGQKIEVLVLKAVLHSKSGAQDDALCALYQAIQLAEEENFIRVFVRQAYDLGPVLKLLLSKGEKTEYISRLLNYIQNPKSLVDVPQESLIEKLTEREIEVLQMLASEITPQEMAQRLFISISTVNTHIGNIYSKLQVNRRYQAVQAGRKLGLLLEEFASE